MLWTTRSANKEDGPRRTAVSRMLLSSSFDCLSCSQRVAVDPLPLTHLVELERSRAALDQLA